MIGQIQNNCQPQQTCKNKKQVGFGMHIEVSGELLEQINTRNLKRMLNESHRLTDVHPDTFVSIASSPNIFENGEVVLY